MHPVLNNMWAYSSAGEQLGRADHPHPVAREHRHGKAEVVGSSPTRSTKLPFGLASILLQLHSLGDSLPNVKKKWLDKAGKDKRWPKTKERQKPSDLSRVNC